MDDLRTNLWAFMEKSLATLLAVVVWSSVRIFLYRCLRGSAKVRIFASYNFKNLSL